MTQLFLMLGALLLLVCALLTLPALRCRQWQQAAGAAMFVTLVSAGLYALLGSPRVVSPAEMHNAMIEMLDEKITHYSELVKKEPENLEA
jgi:ABC-type Mn2+/Zn2+ transport system permease subunit